MFVSPTETLGQLQVSQLQSRLEALPSANLSSVNLTKRLYLDSLIKKASSQTISDKPRLSANIMLKAEKALSEIEANLQTQKQQAEQQLAIIEEDHEHVFEKAKSFIEAHSYFALTQLFNSVSHKKHTHAFKELVAEMGSVESHISATGRAEKSATKRKPTELQSFQQYQAMFDKMALERLLSKVMKEIPENAGPLNPERLVIRAFKALQDISPDYLSQLISYYESLLTLQLLNNSEK